MVATPQIRQMTVEEFDQYVLLPENKDRRLEYIAGRIVELVSNSYCYPKAPHETWISLPLDLAVEVISPTDEEHDVRAKAFNSVRAGAVVWIVDPDKRVVQILAPDTAPRTLTVNDTLDGGTVLPGFTLPVKDIFPE